ncbi:MAG: hypothetical protein ACREA3_00945 [Nitrosotalea sp.]
MILAIVPHYVFADDSNQLDAKTIPNQIMANTDDMIQVYPKTYGSTIENLVATSSDSSIVKIVDVEKDANYGSFDVKIKALTPGQVTIAMAASGFSSLELPVTISSDSEGATNLLIKATPNTFVTSQANVGYIAVETTNPSGIPVPVSVDTPITLSVSDSSVVSLTDNQLVIKQGSYFATEKFVVNNGGTATITASSSSMQPVSTSITSTSDDTQGTLQAYAFPQVINNQKGSIGYVVVQLLGSSGTPVIAKNDIPISISVVNGTDIPGIFTSLSTSTNTSQGSPMVQINDNLVIKKGSYWAYVPVQFASAISAQQNFEQAKPTLFNVYISAKGYAISTSAGSLNIGNQPANTNPVTGMPQCIPTGYTATTSSSTTSSSTTSSSTTSSGTTSSSTASSNTAPAAAQFITCPQGIVIDNKTPFLYSLPILATGNQELIGVLHLAQPSNGAPVLASSDLNFKIDSSDPSTVSVSGVEMDSGSQAAPVFAQVGQTANPVTLNVVSDVPQAVIQTITAPSTTSGLVADSLIPTVLPHTTFPLAIYTTNNGALDSFKNDFNALISPQESISPVQLSVTKGDPIFLTDETLLKNGNQQISIITPDYSSSFTVTGASSAPSSVLLDYPDQIFSNSKTLFSIELLDGKQLPMLANQDAVIKLVSSDPSVLTVPDSVQIPKGSYYATFDAESKTSGTAEIAVLSDEIPLSKFDVSVTSFTPVVSINSDDRDDNNHPLAATVVATYNQLPLAGLTVNWKVTGATIKTMDTLTDKGGNAAISLITNDPNTVSIEASVGGGPYQTVTVTKQVSINPPLQPANSTSSVQANPQSTGFTVMGINPLLFIIPGAAAAAFVVLKKKDMLNGISEKVGIADKFTGIKEKMSNLKQR